MSPLRRTLRGAGFGRNPLLRRTDRIEARLTLLVLALVLLFGAVLVRRSAEATYRDGLRAEREQAARVRVAAVLLADAARPAGAYADAARRMVEAPARWLAPDGSPRTGPVEVASGTRAGAHVTIWVDRDGTRADKPYSREQTVGRAWITGLVVSIVLLVVFHGVRRLVRGAVDLRRAADWAVEWRKVEPRWSGRVP
jgi:hypothetical protein